MITPDKIYIPYYPNYDGIDTHLSDEWFEGKAIDHVEGWKEYIRKDTLEEILRKIKYQMNEGCSDCFDFIDWLRDFIDEQLEEC